MSPEIVRARVIVSGRVQGVAFRWSTRTEAQRVDVAGWVRNLPDGRAEAVFEGTASKVADMITYCSSGPDHARVSALEQFDESPEGLSHFEVTS